MTQQNIPNRIPHEEVAQETQAWAIPEVEDKNAPPKKQPQYRSKQAKEKIEDVSGEVDVKPITAGQLQEMTEQLEKEAYEKGYNEGLAKGTMDGEKQGEIAGKKQAYKEHSQELQNQKQRLSLIADTLFEPMSSQEILLENVVVDMALGIAKHLLNKQLDIDPKAVYPIVERTVATLPAGAKNIRVYLNPDDIELIRDVSSASGKNWHIFPDADLARGGCRVETDESLVDYSIEKRLSQMLTTIEENEMPSSLNLDEVEDYRPTEPEPELTPEPEAEPQAQAQAQAELEAEGHDDSHLINEGQWDAPIAENTTQVESEVAAPPNSDEPISRENESQYDALGPECGSKSNMDSEDEKGR